MMPRHGLLGEVGDDAGERRVLRLGADVELDRNAPTVEQFATRGDQAGLEPIGADVDGQDDVGPLRGSRRFDGSDRSTPGDSER
mgnify:CR=1 FL=1